MKIGDAGHVQNPRRSTWRSAEHGGNKEVLVLAGGTLTTKLPNYVSRKRTQVAADLRTDLSGGNSGGRSGLPRFESPTNGRARCRIARRR
jgi:hypothetical protein